MIGTINSCPTEDQSLGLTFNRHLWLSRQWRWRINGDVDATATTGSAADRQN
jgi:hypothetical protein